MTPDDGSAEVAYPVSKRVRLRIQDGDRVEVGQQLTAGVVDPKEILRILGQRAAQMFLVEQVQEVYRSQGVGIHDKHIEVIVRQMLKKITVIESGSSQLLAGELIDRAVFEARTPKGVAPISEAAGRVRIEDTEKAR